MMRPLQESDMDEVRRLYEESEHKDGWPDFAEMADTRVIVEDGRIVAVGAVRFVPELILILGKGHPAARMVWLKTLYGRMREFLREWKLNRSICFVPPQIEKPYGRRLQRFGFRPGLSAFVYLEDEDVKR